ncbi:MAG: hypothetical protein Q8L14_21835 [Myxococcales bacterium]|nr:hypothetical protein [Myxococcales bacterium]
MRKLSIALLAALLIAACSKSPEGHYVTASSALRVYKEGDGFFLEAYEFGGPHPSMWKPRFVGRLERTEAFWVGRMTGLGDELTLTLTPSGVIATGMGIKRELPRVAEAPPTVLDGARAQSALQASLASMMTTFREKKTCGFGSELSVVRVDATAALMKAAQLKVTAVVGVAASAGPWFDGYSVEGTLELEPLQLEVPDAPVCAKKSQWGGCEKWGKGIVVATSAKATLPFHADLFVSRYPVEMAQATPVVSWTEFGGSNREAGNETVCKLLRQKALAYAERAP